MYWSACQTIGVGSPADDVDRLERTLELLSRKGLRFERLRVGSIEIASVALWSPPSVGDETGDAAEEPILSPEEEAAEAQALFERVQYGATG